MYCVSEEKTSTEKLIGRVYQRTNLIKNALDDRDLPIKSLFGLSVTLKIAQRRLKHEG